MTEAMKSMDSGMAAAEMELRAARRAVPAAVPAEASASLQPSAPPSSNNQLAANAASGDANASKQVSTTPVQKLDLSLPSVPQQTPTSPTGQGSGQPAPAAFGSHDKADHRDREGPCVSESATTAPAQGVSLQIEAGSNAEPTAAGLPQQSSGPAALNPVPPMAQQSQQPAQLLAAAVTKDQRHAMKVSKHVTGVQLHIHADSSAGRGSPTEVVPASSSSGPKAATACLPDVTGQKTTADSTAQGVMRALNNHESIGHASLPASDGSTLPVQSGQVHLYVVPLSEDPKVPTAGAMQCPAGLVSSAVESASGSSGNAAAVSAARQAGSTAVTNMDRSEVSQQQGAAEEPWAAGEGDFADMLKDFLVQLYALINVTVHSRLS